MKILFPYLARWRSANRSRYHQLLTHLCHLGHEVYVLNAPPMALCDISANDIVNANGRLPQGLTISELYAPKILRSFWRTPIRRTKLLKKGLVSVSSIHQIHRFIEREKIDVLLLYNLPQAPLLHLVECRTHFDLADDLVSMMAPEDGVTARAGGMVAARLVQNHMLAQAATVTVASNVLRERINRPVLMLPNGADLEELDHASGLEWRARGMGPTVGFVGAFEYWVNFDLVLEVAQRLKRITFLLVGDGRRMKYIRQQMAILGLRNVILTGAVPYCEAMNYAAGMDVCLLPFTQSAVSHGSCPLKLFEYAALRKPVVSTSIGEVARIGREWIAFADDVTNYAETIESFLADQNAARRAGEAGRAMVEQHYNWPNLAHLFEDLLIKGAAPGIELVRARRTLLEAAKSEFKKLH
ncbi:MAG: glycosyltransferase family 4 protein [Acidobacteria bacterium]|nr:glycosyltransferase family 4 protein [Acidobacteriota bacterium]